MLTGFHTLDPRYSLQLLAKLFHDKHDQYYFTIHSLILTSISLLSPRFQKTVLSSSPTTHFLPVLAQLSCPTSQQHSVQFPLSFFESLFLSQAQIFGFFSSPLAIFLVSAAFMDRGWSSSELIPGTFLYLSIIFAHTTPGFHPFSGFYILV